MNIDWYALAEIPSRHLTRKFKKQARRKEKACRQILVRSAGLHCLASCDTHQILSWLSFALVEQTLRPVKVPRRLRRHLLKRATLGGPWQQQSCGAWLLTREAIGVFYAGAAPVTGDVTAREGDAPQGA